MQQRYAARYALSISLSIQDEKFDNQSIRCYCGGKIFRIKFRGIENIKILEKKKEEKCHKNIFFP